MTSALILQAPALLRHVTAALFQGQQETNKHQQETNNHLAETNNHLANAVGLLQQGQSNLQLGQQQLNQRVDNVELTQKKQKKVLKHLMKQNGQPLGSFDSDASATPMAAAAKLRSGRSRRFIGFSKSARP